MLAAEYVHETVLNVSDDDIDQDSTRTTENFNNIILYSEPPLDMRPALPLIIYTGYSILLS